MKKIKDYLLDLFPAKVWFILILINLIGLLVCFFADSADAAIYIPVQSVDNSMIPISNLINTMVTQDDYDSFQDWVCMNTAENDYYLFYNINDRSASILRLFGTYDGDDLIWHFEKSFDSDFHYQLNNYTVVGNIPGSIGSSLAKDSHDSFINTLSLVALLIVVCFFVFRIRKRQRNNISL